MNVKTEIQNVGAFDKFKGIDLTSVANYNITDETHDINYIIDVAIYTGTSQYLILLGGNNLTIQTDSEQNAVDIFETHLFNQEKKKTPTAILAKELVAAKTKALETLKTIFEAKVEDGYTADNVGTFAIGKEDLTSFTQRLVLLRELADANMLPANTTLKDKDGGMHSLTIVTAKTLILQLGIYADTLWGLYGSKAEAIKNAPTVSLLDEIILTL